MVSSPSTCGKIIVHDRDLYDTYRLTLLGEFIDENNYLIKDSVCFQYPDDEKNIVDLINRLNELEYCTSHRIERMYYRANGSILVAEIDCASG